MADRVDTLHNRLIERAAGEGWSCGGWRQAVRDTFTKPPFRGDGSGKQAISDEILDMVHEVNRYPDAWRIAVESQEHGWDHPVLVLEFLEVEVSHPVTEQKLSEYETLWWQLDATEHFHFRVYRMDRFGLVSPLVTEDTVHILTERHRLDDS